MINARRHDAGLPAYQGEVRTTSSTGGQKGVKPERFDLIPVEALATLARVYAFGATKYDDHNWRQGYEWSKCYAAAMRHLTAFWNGEDNDSESGEPHLAHVAWHCLTLLTFMQEQRSFDDRYGVRKDELEIDRNEVRYLGDPEMPSFSDLGITDEKVKANIKAFQEEVQGIFRNGERIARPPTPVSEGMAVEEDYGVRFEPAERAERRLTNRLWKWF